MEHHTPHFRLHGKNRRNSPKMLMKWAQGLRSSRKVVGFPHLMDLAPRGVASRSSIVTPSTVEAASNHSAVISSRKSFPVSSSRSCKHTTRQKSMLRGSQTIGARVMSLNNSWFGPAPYPSERHHLRRTCSPESPAEASVMDMEIEIEMKMAAGIASIRGIQANKQADECNMTSGK